MTATKYRLICEILTTSLLASACSSPQSSTFSLDLNNFPDSPKFAPSQRSSTRSPPSPFLSKHAESSGYKRNASNDSVRTTPILPTTKTVAQTQPYTAPSHSSSSSESGGGFGEFLGMLLGIGLNIFAMKVASDFVDENYDTSDWTDAEKKVGRQMTRREHEKYYREHPETWTPVYVVPSE